MLFYILIESRVDKEVLEMDMSGEDELKGGMWALEPKIDQPMDEEAGRLKNMHREKVTFL
ncbi:hypothetical protein Hanom_Chr12g01101871 [Helianthus anomalus]